MFFCLLITPERIVMSLWEQNSSEHRSIWVVVWQQWREKCPQGGKCCKCNNKIKWNHDNWVNLPLTLWVCLSIWRNISGWRTMCQRTVHSFFLSLHYGLQTKRMHIKYIPINKMHVDSVRNRDTQIYPNVMNCTFSLTHSLSILLSMHFAFYKKDDDNCQLNINSAAERSRKKWPRVYVITWIYWTLFQATK